MVYNNKLPSYISYHPVSLFRYINIVLYSLVMMKERQEKKRSEIKKETLNTFIDCKMSLKNEALWYIQGNCWLETRQIKKIAHYYEIPARLNTNEEHKRKHFFHSLVFKRA